MKKSVCLGYLLAASLVSGFVPAVAMAQDANDEFSSYMLEGVRYFKEGQSNPAMYQKAIESFEKARKIDDIPDINYNIGRCHHMLGNCQQAAEYYRKYASVSDANAEVVKKYMDALSQECGAGTLTVICSSTPAKVKIDALPGLDCGDETKEIALSPGTHTVVVSADGIVPQTQIVVVKANENAVASFWLTNPEAKQEYAPKSVEMEPAASAASASAKKAASKNAASKSAPAASASVASAAVVADASASAAAAAAKEAPAEAEEFDDVVYAPDTSDAADAAVVADAADAAVAADAADDSESSTSVWFWSGLGSAGVGTLLSIIGGAVLASSHDEFVFSTGRNSGLITVYERDKSKYVGGQAVLGVGLSMTIVGVTLIVLDKFVFSKKKDSTSAQVAPVINLSPDLAGAGVAVSF